MEALRQYVLSVSSVAILCGLVISMTPKGAIQGIIKLVCGVFLAILVVQPVTQLNPERILSRFTGQTEADGEAAAAFGEEIARDSMSVYIKEKSEAYILDKARSLGFDLEPDVTVGDGACPVPESVRITGSIPIKSRNQLAEEFEKELGISKENQIWTG